MSRCSLLARLPSVLVLPVLLLAWLAIPVSGAAQVPPSDNETAERQDAPQSDAKAEPLVVTEADRIARLQAAIQTDQKALEELRTQLEQRRAEEESAGTEFQQIVQQLETLTQQLQQAEDQNNQEAVAEVQQKLEPLTKTRDLGKEKFDLAILARKTTQEQIATLETKLAQEKTALEKLKGSDVSASEAPVVDQPPASADSGTAAPSTVGTAPSAAAPPEAAETPTPVADRVPETKAEKVARKEVEEKEQALEDLEQDLEKLDQSKSLLEKNIELETQTLDTARKQYDNLEKVLETAEANFNLRLDANAPANELQQLRSQIAGTQKQLRDGRAAIRKSTDRLQELRQELLGLQNEETALVKQTEQLQRQAQAAKRSELYIRAQQYVVSTAPKLLAILAVMIVLWGTLKLGCARAKKWIDKDACGTRAERKHRSETLIGVFQTTGRAVIVLGGILMSLDAARVPIAPLLGGAGVVGLAIAFAAQNLIKDYFCGFILLLENQFKLGDVVTINGMSGSVERMTLRLTVLRNLDGHVFYVPNGQITAVKNSTAGWARAVVDIGVAYKESTDRVSQVLLEIAEQLKAEDEFGRFILGEPEMFGVDALGDSAIVLRLGLKVRPDQQWSIKRELLRRIKQRFDELDIEIPFPQQTVHHRIEDGKPFYLAGEASAMREDN